MTEQALKVLIVDDEAGIVDYMHKILDLKGFNTMTALESNSAIELFKKERPEICILDVHLSYSPLDGIEILAKIKEIDQNAKCVMVTRITDQGKVSRAKELGASNYILKPVDTKDLLSVVYQMAEDIKKERSARG